MIIYSIVKNRLQVKIQAFLQWMYFYFSPFVFSLHQAAGLHILSPAMVIHRAAAGATPCPLVAVL